MLEPYAYCPRILARRAEIKALFQLPASSKDLLLPMIAAAPWPNGKHLFRTWEKISEALGGRRYALDIDETYAGTDSPRPAAAEFAALRDPTNGYDNYYRQVVDLPNAIPVFRLVEGADDIRAQLANVERADRGLFVRLWHNGPNYSFDTLAAIKNSGLDFVLFVDAGWDRELLLREAWTQRVIEQITDAADRVEVVVCGSSFPDSFADIRARKEISLEERHLFASMTRRFNEVRITYGDWASTRPRQPPTPMNIVPRIDIALPQSWISFRQSEEETYGDIARRVVSDRTWLQQPKIWGINTIEWTAEELPGAIKNPEANTAARVNIHLHRQAQFNAAIIVNDADEPFTDD
ncbi:MAG: hypothetical protein NW206_02800 [Hyphomonadaceae bacterium]|nr:hypothetical protein [Hyphomonadaceae bacterium]